MLQNEINNSLTKIKCVKVTVEVDCLIVIHVCKYLLNEGQPSTERDLYDNIVPFDQRIHEWELLWLTNIADECIVHMLALATFLRIPSLCNLLLSHLQTTYIGHHIPKDTLQQTRDLFFN